LAGLRQLFEKRRKKFFNVEKIFLYHLQKFISIFGPVLGVFSKKLQNLASIKFVFTHSKKSMLIPLKERELN